MTELDFLRRDAIITAEAYASKYADRYYHKGLQGLPEESDSEIWQWLKDIHFMSEPEVRLPAVVDCARDGLDEDELETIYDAGIQELCMRIQDLDDCYDEFDFIKQGEKQD